MRVICIDDTFYNINSEAATSHPSVGDIDEVIGTKTNNLGWLFYELSRFPKKYFDVDNLL